MHLGGRRRPKKHASRIKLPTDDLTQVVPDLKPDVEVKSEVEEQLEAATTLFQMSKRKWKSSCSDLSCASDSASSPGSSPANELVTSSPPCPSRVFLPYDQVCFFPPVWQPFMAPMTSGDRGITLSPEMTSAAAFHHNWSSIPGIGPQISFFGFPPLSPMLAQFQQASQLTIPPMQATTDVSKQT